jgi:ABC-type nitrate/sulfonate/bicarbonate transport system permease component
VANFLSQSKRLRESHFSGVFNYFRSVFVITIIWYFVSIAVKNHAILPSPFVVASDALSLLLKGEVHQNTLVSLRRLLISFLIAGGIGVPLGILMGLNRWARELIDPVVEILRPISGIAWIPLGLFIFGVGDELPIFIMTYVALFPFLLQTIAGVRQTDTTLIRAALTLGVSQRTIIRQVILPSTVPNILVGARIAAGTCWVALVAAELIGAPSGLGFSIEWYRELLMTSKTISFICYVSLAGYLTDRILRYVNKKLIPWSTDFGKRR